MPRSDDSIAKQLLQCTLQIHRDRKQTKNPGEDMLLWRRDLVTKMCTAGFRYNWKNMEALIQDRE